MSPSRRARGRTIVFVGALGFVVLSALVVWRRGQGVALSRQMRVMQDSLRRLAVERADLEREIRQASDRAHILDAARRLGLREPADSQVRTLPRPPAREAITDTTLHAGLDATP